jgi:F-type H+-transporting ATPase subunit b
MLRMQVSPVWMLWLVAGLFSVAVQSALADSKATLKDEVKAEIKEIAKEETGHDEHEHHDPTHAFAGAMQANPMEFRSDGAIFSFIVFMMLLATLGIFAWKPISEGLAKRESFIAKALEDAKKASEAAAASMKEYEAKIAAAQSQASEIVNEARKAAEASGQRILAEAKSEAERQRDRALSDIETAKQAALSELTGKSTDMAFGLARRVVGRELNANDHQKLIQDALASMPSRN